MKVKTNTIKIILDIIMTVLLMWSFSKRVGGIRFHEIVGLGVCFLFIVHKFLNRKWIIAVSKGLFKKTTPTKTRIQYIVDVLLLTDFLVILITGLGMSKSVMPALFGSNFGWNTNAKLMHFFTSAIAVILIGIHLGLHWSWIRGVFTNMFKKTKGKSKFSVGSVIGCVVVLVIMGYGCYALTQVNFIRWLSIPGQMISSSPEELNSNQGRPPQQAGNEGIQQGEAGSQMTTGGKSSPGGQIREGHGAPSGVQGGKGSLPTGFVPKTAITVFIQWFSIVFIIAVLVQGITVVINKDNKKKKLIPNK